MEGRVVRSLYRSLYRLTHVIGSNRVMMGALYRINPETESGGDSTSRYCNQILGKVFGKKTFLVPPPKESLKALLRMEFKSDSEFPLQTRIDGGFMFLRKLSSLRNGFDSATKLKSTEVKPTRTVEPVFQFDLQPHVENGMLLVAHPMLSGSLHRTVILILEHTSKTSYGLVINRPTLHTLKSAVKNLPAEFVTRFGDQKVFFGGMVRRMQFLHSVPSCGGNIIPFCSSSHPALYSGGSVHAAVKYAKQNPADISKFTLFVGCCCWEPGQLEKEIEAGYWIVGKSPPDILLNHMTTYSSSPTSDNQQGDHSIVEHDIYPLLLNSLGEDFKSLANIPHWLNSSSLESCDMM